MRPAYRSFKSGLADTVGFGGFFFWRGLERCLGVEPLCAAARAFYLCRATFNELFKRRPPPRDEPEWLRTDGSLGARIRRRAQKYLNYLLKDFPDRLASAKWRSRCRLEGVEHLEAARRAGRPAVLAFFHFGPVYIMRQWARANGFPTAAFVHGQQEVRSRLARYPDRLTPFPEMPLYFYPRTLRALTKFLAAGNILFIAVDTAVGRHTTVEAGDGWILKLNSGPARLAHGAGADLIPCSIVTEGPWRYRIKFGTPMPGEGLRTEADWAAANQRLLDAVLPDFKAHPEQFDLPRAWKQANDSESHPESRPNASRPAG